MRPGQYAKVKAEVAIARDALLIPMRCVMELQGQFSVYVVNDSSKVESRQVSVGEKVNDLWQITEGISATDKIIIDGLQKVRSGLVVKSEIVKFNSQSQK